MKFEFKRVDPSPDIKLESWNSWIWQMQNSYKSSEDFEKAFQLDSDEKKGFQSDLFNIRTTPYYAKLAGENPLDPIRRILMPHLNETKMGQQSLLDPLGERKNNPVRRIIHRYSDRVLFLVTDTCSVYCRYCTRKHFTGQEQALIKKDEYALALDYIKHHPGIREVILSGGDPLTLGDHQLENILKDLREIEHVEIIRIGTRMPVVCPMRVTDSLVQILRKYNPIYIMNHFNHPREVTHDAAQALSRLADSGIPLMNQMVLLNGINNHPAIVQALSRRLLYLRVKPYYMFQCDPSEGTDHLRTSIDESEAIQKELWGHLSGLALPNLSLDIPEGGGKAALVPQFETHRDDHSRTYKGWDGVQAQYIQPSLEQRILPFDYEQYLPEWEQIKKSKN